MTKIILLRTPNTDNMGKLFVTLFAPAEAGFRSFAPQLLLLHPRQIRNGCCTPTSVMLTKLCTWIAKTAPYPPRPND